MIEYMIYRHAIVIVVVLFLSLFSVFPGGRFEGEDQSSLSEEESGRQENFTFITLDPLREKTFHGAGNSRDELLAAQLFTGPLEVNPETGTPVPALASEWSFSADRMSCRLQLGDVSWSDGTPITASQLKASWLMVLQNGGAASSFLASRIKGGQEYLKGSIPEDELGIRILNSRLLEIEFERPCSPEILAAPAFYVYPSELFNGEDSLYGLPDGLRTSGAYTIDRKEDGLIVLKLRPERRIAGSGPESLHIIIPDDRVHALELYNDRQADWLAPDAFPPQYIKDAEGRADYSEPAGNNSYFYIFNGGRRPLDDLEFRRFLISTVDRDLLLEELKRGARLRADSLLPPEVITEADGAAENTREFFSLPKPAGEYSREKYHQPEVLILICPSDKGHVAVAEALIRQWRDKAGINVDLKIMEGRDFVQARKDGDYHLAFGGWSFGSPYAADFFIHFLPGALYGGTGSASFEKSLMELLMTDPATRRRHNLIKETMNALVPGESLILPLFFNSRPQLIRQNSWKEMQAGGWYPPRLYRLYKF